MPSIRVKGQVYSSLEAAISTNDDTLCLRAELAGSPNTYPSVQPKLSLPLLPRGVSDVTSPPSPSRPRSATTSSRIHAHCINTSRHYQPPEPLPNPPNKMKSTSTSNVDNETTSQGVMTIEGVQTDVRVTSHVEPGIVESSIFTADEDYRRPGFSDHHHDDVVEHLDVIGISPFFFSYLETSNNIISQIHKLVPFQVSLMPQMLS